MSFLSPPLPGSSPGQACKSGGELLREHPAYRFEFDGFTYLFALGFGASALGPGLPGFDGHGLCTAGAAVGRCLAVHAVVILGGISSVQAGILARLGYSPRHQESRDGAAGIGPGLGGCPCRRARLPSLIEAGGCVPAWVPGRSEMLLTAMIISRVLTICCRDAGCQGGFPAR